MWCSALSLLFIVVLTNPGQANSEQSLPLLLLVSFDGFRHDYPSLHGPLKNFRRLAKNGVRATQLTPSFVTATFPNHYSLVTGLHEETHGLISNYMFDPQTRQAFDSKTNLSSAQWWPHPAIWSVNERRHGARSGVSGWPQDRIWVSRYAEFHRSRTFREIIDQMLQWFTDPSEPINFGAMYFYEPDLTGHRTGPYSKNMTEIVRLCDEHLGYLLDQIEQNAELRQRLHLIVTSDHGMAQINGTTNPIYLEDFLDVRQANAFSISSVASIFVNNQTQLQTVWTNLSRIPHSICYHRADIPDRYHYKSHDRVGDLLLVMDPGYEIHERSSRKKYDLTLTHGNHGYDNQDESMKGIFYAMGPEFKRNFLLDRSAALYNVDLFNLMCYILQIENCPSSNGTISHIEPLLVDAERLKDFFRSNDRRAERILRLFGWIVLGLTVVFALLWFIFSFRSASARRQRQKRFQSI